MYAIHRFKICYYTFLLNVCEINICDALLPFITYNKCFFMPGIACFSCLCTVKYCFHVQSVHKTFAFITVSCINQIY